MIIRHDTKRVHAFLELNKNSILNEPGRENAWLLVEVKQLGHVSIRLALRDCDLRVHFKGKGAFSCGWNWASTASNKKAA